MSLSLLQDPFSQHFQILTRDFTVAMAGQAMTGQIKQTSALRLFQQRMKTVGLGKIAIAQQILVAKAEKMPAVFPTHQRFQPLAGR